MLNFLIMEVLGYFMRWEEEHLCFELNKIKSGNCPANPQRSMVELEKGPYYDKIVSRDGISNVGSDNST